MASKSLSALDTVLPRTGALDPLRENEICKTGALLVDRPDGAQPLFLAEWDELASSASEPNPFFESWYLLPSLLALDPHAGVRLLTIRQGGKLIGLLPLQRTWNYYGYPLPNLAAWAHANCFLGAPLVGRGEETAFWTVLLHWADENAGSGLFLHLPQVPLDGALIGALRQVVNSQDRPAALVHREERAMLRSDLCAEDYFTHSMSGKKRKELRRQHKRLSETGEIAVSRHIDSAGIDSWIADFLKLELSGWKGRAGSALGAAGPTSEMFTQALKSAAARGQLERLAISLDGKPVAMLANFLTSTASFAYKTAFDEAYAQFSPGVLLQRENLKMLDRKGTAWADSCASADHLMIDRIWRERRAIGRVSVGIGGNLRRTIFRQLARHETGHEPDGIGR